MRVSLLALPALALSAACFYATDPPPYRPPALMESETALSGEQLYARDCGWCHGDRGQGTPSGPDLVGSNNGRALTHFMLTTGRMPIDHPTQQARRGSVIYTDEQIRALVDHVAAFGGTGPDVPRVDPARGDLAVGKELYNENCAACHSTTGVGGAMTEGRDRGTMQIEGRRAEFIAPGLRDVDAVETAEAVLLGPGTMPPFEALFDAHEMDSLVRFVLDLRAPATPGGRPLELVGPVAEGAVTWIVGLAALLLAARWIGTKVEEDE